VISVMGDGGLQMLIAELGVVGENSLDIKIILFNNQRLGMVRELQEKQYGKGCIYGVVFEHSPDFVKIAEGFGVKGTRVISNEEFERVFKDSLNMGEAFFIEATVDPDFSTI
ncbi:MAG TPA: thiamine pyrophosphate-dependent enzyme, partial [Clostridia bacterium]|nr:thiamine pyrophosphate-dependent enzyme [Clostridia bacterium]